MGIRGDIEAIKHEWNLFWSGWSELFEQLPDWLFVSEPEPEPIPLSKPDVWFESHRIDLKDDPDEIEKEYERELERLKEISDQRKTFHEETSKTVRRVFYTLVGTSLFCVVTLFGTQDADLIKADAKVTLPILNFPMSFEAFLVVGPVVLISLSVYMHIFVGELRRYEVRDEDKQAMLLNYTGWASRTVVILIFYWMISITLAVFTWKAWPRPIGPYLGYVTMSVASAFTALQFRRCPRTWRGWALPLLIATYATFYVQLNYATSARDLNLSKAVLSKQDLRKANLSGADLSDAILLETNLEGADLSNSKMINADLTNANLSKTKLYGANLSQTKVTDDQLLLACLDDQTQLPDHVNPVLRNPKSITIDTMKFVRPFICDLESPPIVNISPTTGPLGLTKDDIGRWFGGPDPVQYPIDPQSLSLYP